MRKNLYEKFERAKRLIEAAGVILNDIKNKYINISKRSPYRNTIFDKVYYNDDNTSKVAIKWFDSITCGARVSKGVAKRNPEDTPNSVLGLRIAEGRAKIAMYKSALDSLETFYRDRVVKYSNLVEAEEKHINKLIAEAYDK